MRGVILLQGIACLLPVTFAAEWSLWVSAVSVTALASIMWPIVESYVTAGRHGPSMRSAIGWFNIVWMPATALPLLVTLSTGKVHVPCSSRNGAMTNRGSAV